MEEDIKELENFCEIFRMTQRSLDKYEREDYGEIIGQNEIQAIENLIKGYKELEECLKAEEKYAEGLNNDIKSLLNIEPNDNFIPKSKIREKIEEYKKSCIGCMFQDNFCKELQRNKQCVPACMIQSLEELLQEGDKKI